MEKNQEYIKKIGREYRCEIHGHVEISIILLSHRIKEAHFSFHQCGFMRFVCCELHEMILGRTVEEAYSITAEKLFEKIKWLPETKIHYCELVLSALRKALLAEEVTEFKENPVTT